MRVLILGAGGHAQVVADILLQAASRGSTLAPLGYLDDDRTLLGERRLGLPILGTIDQIDDIEHDAVIIGIGHNPTRHRLFEEMQDCNQFIVTAYHPSSIVGGDVEVGPGSVLCAGAIVNPGSRIGANVIINTGATVDHHNVLGDHVHIGPGAHLGGDVRVGTGTLIGIGSTIMPQRTVGAWSVVGAGGVVTTNIGDECVVVGVPARSNRAKV
ncbi:MAG: acetyltransferase [Caldilineaceae bacterium]|nr:acetyltransferase [Caldilineaceae bacterium]